MKVAKALAHQSSYARSNFGGIFNLVFLTVLAVLMALPMVFTVSNAFKPLDELFVFPPKLWVSNPTLNNFLGISSILRDSWVPLSAELSVRFCLPQWRLMFWLRKSFPEVRF